MSSGPCCELRFSTPCKLKSCCLAGQIHSAQHVFSALLPHLPAIQTLKGAHQCFSLASESRESLARWETFWSCVPNLRTLTWSISSRDIPGVKLTTIPAFGLPFSLSHLDLTIWWGHGRRHSADMPLLEALGWHQKLVSLKMDTPGMLGGVWSEAEVGDVRFGYDDGPQLQALDSLHCRARSLDGSVIAPQLRVLELRLSSLDPFKWAWFELCNRLEHVDVCLNGAFNALGCSFPDSLRELSLDVGGISEDGCFQNAPPHLEHLHISCLFKEWDVIDLRPFTSRGPADVQLDVGVLTVRMPPENDPQWSRWQVFNRPDSYQGRRDAVEQM